MKFNRNNLAVSQPGFMFSLKTTEY